MEARLTSVGELLREWRRRRRMSQLDLALDAEISARHLSFVETGRSTPSRAMLMRLAAQLDVPLRERNTLLLAAGFAPLPAASSLDAPSLRPARDAIEALLAAHEPFPALAVDRYWTLLAANRAIGPLLDGVAAHLLAPPVNVMRVGLHPEGMAPRIANLAEWRGHALFRLRRQLAETGDRAIAALIRELAAYPAGGSVDGSASKAVHDADAIAIPLRVATRAGPVSLLSATMVFGTPLDATLAEIAIETFLPADAASGETLRRLAAERDSTR